MRRQAFGPAFFIAVLLLWKERGNIENEDPTWVLVPEPGLIIAGFLVMLAKLILSRRLVRGVIDSRCSIDPVDQEAVNFLLSVYEKYTYFDLSSAVRPLCRKLRGTKVPEEIEKRWEKKRYNSEELGKEAFDIACLAAETVGQRFNHGTVLDLGSGMGALLPTLSRNFDRVYGVELSLKNQLIARRLAEETGLDNVTLIAGAAEEQHFSSNSFDLIIMNNVIEHVSDVDRVLFLTRKYLKPGGVICFDSSNRYNLFFYEPHTLLWGVGFLPRKYMSSYVKMRTGCNYEDVRLLSLPDLKRYLRRYFPSGFSVIITPLHPGNVTGIIKQIFERVRTMPVISEVAKLFVPSLYVVAKK